MPDYTSIITAFNVSVNERITEKDTVNSIDPIDVGGSITDFSDLLLPILNLINEFNILSGNIPPTDAQGQDNDMYFEFGAQLKVYKRLNPSSPFWALKASGDLGVNILDGNISLQTSVNENIVTVSSGNWGIDNTIYSKTTQDQYTIPIANLNFDRIDGVFAKNDGTVEYVTGVASSTPAEPATLSNSVRINFIYVPSSSSGNPPYILDSNNAPVVPPQLDKLMYTNVDLVANGEDNYYLPVNIPSGRIPLGLRIDYEVGNPEYMPGGNIVDGKWGGFTNNNTSVITVKIG